MMGIPQESSYDNFEMYGYAAYLLSQWLRALAGAIQAADLMGDAEASKRYTSIFQSAQKRMEEKLWTGSYYRLFNDETKAGGHGGHSDACFTDQIVGQWAAHASALGYIHNRDHVRSALRHIFEVSYQPEIGLRNCSWPGGKYWSVLQTCEQGGELSAPSMKSARTRG